MKVSYIDITNPFFQYVDQPFTGHAQSIKGYQLFVTLQDENLFHSIYFFQNHHFPLSFMLYINKRQRRGHHFVSKFSASSLWRSQVINPNSNSAIPNDIRGLKRHQRRVRVQSHRHCRRRRPHHRRLDRPPCLQRVSRNNFRRPAR